MTPAYVEQLNAWHLELAITADAIKHVFDSIEEPQGLSATSYVLNQHLLKLVESCPFPDLSMLANESQQVLDYDDLSDTFPDDLAGVPAELLCRTGGRHD